MKRSFNFLLKIILSNRYYPCSTPHSLLVGFVIQGPKRTNFFPPLCFMMGGEKTFIHEQTLDVTWIVKYLSPFITPKMFDNEYIQLHPFLFSNIESRMHIKICMTKYKAKIREHFMLLFSYLCYKNFIHYLKEQTD